MKVGFGLELSPGVQSVKVLKNGKEFETWTLVEITNDLSENLNNFLVDKLDDERVRNLNIGFIYVLPELNDFFKVRDTKFIRKKQIMEMDLKFEFGLFDEKQDKEIVRLIIDRLIEKIHETDIKKFPSEYDIAHLISLLNSFNKTYKQA